MLRRLFGGGDQQAEITPNEVHTLQQAGTPLQILDVREPAEYAEAHVAGSVLIPLGQLAQQLDQLDKDRPVVALCRSGNRSGVALGMLQRAGFQDVRNLRGGISAWAKAGLPLERGGGS